MCACAYSSGPRGTQLGTTFLRFMPASCLKKLCFWTQECSRQDAGSLKVIARPAEAGVVSMWGRGVGGIVFGVIKVAAAHLCDRIFSRQRGKVGKENA